MSSDNVEKVEKARVNLYLPQYLKDYVWKEAEKQGFNFTTMVQVMIMDYKKQQDALEMNNIYRSLESAITKVEVNG